MTEIYYFLRKLIISYYEKSIDSQAQEFCVEKNPTKLSLRKIKNDNLIKKKK